MVEVCKYMGWDYYKYNDQPVWFIELIKLKMNLDAEHQRKWQQTHKSQQ